MKVYLVYSSWDDFKTEENSSLTNETYFSIFKLVPW